MSSGYQTEDSQFSSQDETLVETHGIPPLKRFQRLKPSKPREHFEISKKMVNYGILKEFQALTDWYSSEPGERFRGQAYRKIMDVLVEYPQKITSGDQLKDMPGIGAKTVEKIQEIIDRKPDRLSMHIPEYVSYSKEFQRVRGVGPKKARTLYDRGCRNLKDIRPYLTKIQQAYLDNLNDLEVPVEEQELLMIFERVKNAALEVDAQTNCELVGSYRRRSNLFFDVDILIYPTVGEKLPDSFLDNVVERLNGFIRDKLSHSRTGKPQSFKGICAIGPKTRSRKIDIFTCDKSEVGSALLHWTGSSDYIRALKLYANRIGLVFSQHGLHVLKKDSGVKEAGRLVCSGETEKEIYQTLGLEYIEPYLRNG